MFHLHDSLLSHNLAALPSFCLPMLDLVFARMLDTNFSIVMTQRFPSRSGLDDIIGFYPMTHHVGHQMQL
jgi:hypothetical protein